MNNPIFSVVVPLYNKAPYIKKCIQSVINQTLKNYEILVVDDGSTDDSIALIRNEFGEKVKILEKINGGVSSARNLGIQMSRGIYVAFLDADDEYEPRFLEETYNLFDKYKNATAAATGFFYKNDDRKTASFVPEIFVGKSGIIDDFYRYWAQSAFFFTSSVSVKKEFFVFHNKWFPEAESIGEDQEVWFSIAELGSIAYSSKHLSNYNISVDHSLTRTANLTEELPFASRLRSRYLLGNVIDSRSIFLEKYDIERAINCGLNQKKKNAFRLLCDHIKSKRFLGLKCLALVIILTPAPAIDFFRFFKRWINA